MDADAVGQRPVPSGLGGAAHQLVITHAYRAALQTRSS
jgi:hypothetical protein